MTQFPLLKTEPKALLLMVFCTLFVSTGQILWKWGVETLSLTNPLTLLNLPFIFGTLSYGVASILLLMAFRKGELSVLFPTIATSYVWVSLASPLFIPNDFMNPWKWAGIILIVASVSLLGWSATR